MERKFFLSCLALQRASSFCMHSFSCFVILKQYHATFFNNRVAESGWKFGYFLFEIEPSARIHHSKGATTKFFVRHNVKQTTHHGEELIGTGFFANEGINPDLFISNHFHWCKSLFMDVPFSSKIEAMEVWGIEELREGQSLKAGSLTKKDAPQYPQ